MINHELPPRRQEAAVARPMQNKEAARAVLDAWPKTSRGLKARPSSREAQEVVKAFFRARGWRLDPRAGRGVLLSPDGQRRVKLKATSMSFEKGGRGCWQRDYQFQRYGEVLSPINYATTIKDRALAAGVEPAAAKPAPVAPARQTTPTLKGWIARLSEEDRERLFVWIREKRDEASRYEQKARRLSPRQGEVAVGAAHFDEWIKGYAIERFLYELGSGARPQEATEAAKRSAHETVKAHNVRRERDVNWARHEATADPFIEELHRSLKRVNLPEARQPRATLTLVEAGELPPGTKNI